MLALLLLPGLAWASSTACPPSPDWYTEPSLYCTERYAGQDVAATTPSPVAGVPEAHAVRDFAAARYDGLEENSEAGSADPRRYGLHSKLSVLFPRELDLDSLQSKLAARVDRGRFAGEHAHKSSGLHQRAARQATAGGGRDGIEKRSNRQQQTAALQQEPQSAEMEGDAQHYDQREAGLPPSPISPLSSSEQQVSSSSWSAGTLANRLELVDSNRRGAFYIALMGTSFICPCTRLRVMPSVEAVQCDVCANKLWLPRPRREMLQLYAHSGYQSLMEAAARAKPKRDVEPDWSYEGCFTSHLLEGFPLDYGFVSNHTAVEECLGICGSQGFNIAGVAHGMFCLCNTYEWSHFESLSHRTKEDYCSSPCEGDQTEMCGGDMVMNLYRFNGIPEFREPNPADGDTFERPSKAANSASDPS